VEHVRDTAFQTKERMKDRDLRPELVALHLSGSFDDGDALLEFTACHAKDTIEKADPQRLAVDRRQHEDRVRRFMSSRVALTASPPSAAARLSA
jgi:hypothetical protein